MLIVERLYGCTPVRRELTHDKEHTKQPALVQKVTMIRSQEADEDVDQSHCDSSVR